MSPFDRPSPVSFGGLYPARPYALPLRGGGPGDRLVVPSSGSTGYRGARPTFGGMTGLAESVLQDWRRKVAASGVPARFLPQSSTSRGAHTAPDAEAAWDCVFVPEGSVSRLRSLAYDVGISRGLTPNFAETGYWTPEGAWTLVTWSLGPDPRFSADSKGRLADGERQVRADVARGSSPVRYGEDAVEVSMGPVSVRGDVQVAMVMVGVGLLARFWGGG